MIQSDTMGYLGAMVVCDGAVFSLAIVATYCLAASREWEPEGLILFVERAWL